ncbi:hypothetical protein GCM10010123_33020 [Pilimelia anulata]|uniref:Uncharacterized protein n=1 Tax=Pilimelia anulata TaxID=53371 RepID=A0A8J3BAB4_9ACTN|nr:hypothetical protein [Pilimelia anulata]GGK00505.1 hypothetical protein GCM10010123_33020 [Pilimelia anulata]
MPLRARTIATAALLLLPAAPAPAAAAEPAPLCAGGHLRLRIDPGTGAVSGAGTLHGCAVPGRGGPTGATITIRGSAPVRTPLTLVTVTADTVEWDRGGATTFTNQRTIVGRHAVAMTGAGEAVAGAPRPRLIAESGTGHRAGDTPTTVDLTTTLLD